MRHKLFWTLYFGASTAAIALAALLMPQHMKLNWYSLFPAGYAIVDILLALFVVSNLPQRLHDWNMEWRRVHYWGGKVDEPYEKSTYFVDHAYRQIDAQITLSALPMWLMFALFFGNRAKILSVLIFLVPICARLIHMEVNDHLTAKAERQKNEAELRRQISREQEGRWK